MFLHTSQAFGDRLLLSGAAGPIIGLVYGHAWAPAAPVLWQAVHCALNTSSPLLSGMTNSWPDAYPPVQAVPAVVFLFASAGQVLARIDDKLWQTRVSQARAKVAKGAASYSQVMDTKGEKMGPFRLDLGPHIFRGIAARLLPSGLRQ